MLALVVRAGLKRLRSRVILMSKIQETTRMQTIPLGKHGLEISRLGLGCMGMSALYGATDEAESLRTLDRALETGISFWDTSDIYGPHTNEELIANALDGRRNEAVLATKFGLRFDDGKLGICGRPEYVKQACEASLKRLQTDCIDLYYLHRIDPQVPVAETVGAMARLIEEGKVRYLGLSEASSGDLQSASAEAPISALQSEYSLWTRDIEADILETCRELGIGVVAYSPLGRGFLSGLIASRDDLDDNDWRRTNPRFTEENLRQNKVLADRVQEMASAKGVTPAQFALAWVLAQGDDVTAIPGTKRVRYLEDNAAAVSVGFSDSELQEIEDAFPTGAAVGARY